MLTKVTVEQAVVAAMVPVILELPEHMLETALTVLDQAVAVAQPIIVQPVLEVRAARESSLYDINASNYIKGYIMNLPFELRWGVDIAIKKIRPSAHFELAGINFTKWDDSICNSEPPAWEEVMAQLAADQKAAEEWQQNNT
jgi:hypothetical protein